MQYTVTAKNGNRIVHKIETDSYDDAMDFLDQYIDSYGHFLKIEMLDKNSYGKGRSR